MNKRSPKAVTEYERAIGVRIREARIAAGITQTELGELIGVSYQQVQKYEAGHNRLSGARIERMVTALNRPVSYFIPNATDVRLSIDPGRAFLAMKDGQALATLWPHVPAKARRAVIDLIEELTAGDFNG